MRKSREQEAAILENMRRGVQTYVQEQKTLGHHPCDVLVRYVSQLEGGTLPPMSEEDFEDFEGLPE